jgi:hypothetical protein
VNACHRHRRRQRAQLIVLEGEIKKARGLGPAPLGSDYLFLAVLRRAVPVFFAVVFFAAAVLRFAGFFRFATAMMSLLSGWLAFNSLCYTHSLLDTYSHSRYVASQRG